jgi:hypothetical protein
VIKLFRVLRNILMGRPQPPALPEERYPRDATGRPDLSRFDKPLSAYAAYLEDYHASLGAHRSRDATWQAYAYRKGVIGQWGIIARGPQEGLSYVLRLLKHRLPEARAAGASIFNEWSAGDTLTPHLLEAFETEDDIETLSVLADALARRKALPAIPRMAALLRDPASANGDLDWSMMEALSTISGENFRADPDPKAAAERWLRAQGY